MIVFDEPTSSLSEHDAERLFAIVERLRGRGLAIIYISHFLEEARRVAQTYTVLRDGQAVAAGRLAETDLKSIIAHMVGPRPGRALSPRAAHARRAGPRARPAARPQDRQDRRAWCCRRGEILGIAGLIGAGRTTLVRSIFGLAPVVAGRVRVQQFTRRLRATANAHRPGGRVRERRPQDRRAGPVALDRRQHDLFRAQAACAVGLAQAQRAARRGRPAGSRGCGSVQRAPARPTANLSGGNQQKVALARLLHQQADVLLLDEPTRGIDVGSKAEIYRLIGEQAAAGKAILVVSSYLPELFGICDRIAVMSRGALSEARPVSQWTEHEVMDVATRTDVGSSRTSIDGASIS